MPAVEVLPQSGIAQIIASGESFRVEFKSTFEWDLDQGKRNRELRFVVAKTLAAFMNADGGKLLIGVSDNGEVLGIEHDLAVHSQAEDPRDQFERCFTQSIGALIGSTAMSFASTSFVEIEGNVIFIVTCERASMAVYVGGGNSPDRFFVRQGNSSTLFTTREAVEYLSVRYPVNYGDASSPAMTEIDADDALNAVDSDTEDSVNLTAGSRNSDAEPRPGNLALSVGEVAERGPRTPDWVELSTTNVLNLFLRPLARAQKLESIYIISPWITEFEGEAEFSFQQLLRKIREDQPLLHVVTREPKKRETKKAIRAIEQTNLADIVFVKDLHAKLFWAQTDRGSFALVGSANFTANSLSNHEIGVRFDSYSEGAEFVKRLKQEAYRLYRSDGAKRRSRSKFVD